MRRVLLATTLSSLLAPAAALAQVPIYGGGGDAPRTLDPGAVERPATATPPKTEPAKPNVIVVGPDGKVTYDAPGAGGAQQPAGPYYYGPGDTGFGSDPGNDQPVSVHAGPTPDLHVVRSGDTLWDISFFYFNDPWQWPKVWSYNPQITNPHWIYPGDLVRLLPRGMFAEQPTGPKEPEAGGEVKPPDNLPPPSKSSNVGLKQTAFVEKSDLDKSIRVDGSVDEKELLAVGDSVYLSYPANNPPKVGQRYSIYKPDNPVKAAGKDVGAYVKILGAVEIVSVKQDKRARGVIVEGNMEIERGAKVGPLVKQFQNVAPVAPKVDAQGSIVALITKDQLIGQGELVFVDLGKNSGVEPGNRMFVVRRGDALPPQSKNTIGQDDRRFPARALGEVVIVEVGENVSIALVTLSVQEMGLGDIVMMQKAE